MPNVRPDRRREVARNLPLRWVVILAVAAGTGVTIGYFTSVAAGVAAGVCLATFLHKAID